MRSWRRRVGTGGATWFSPNDYRDVAKIWTGPAPDGSGDLEVVDGPPEGGQLADLADVSESFAPEYHPGEIYEIAQKIYEIAQKLYQKATS